jgi:hypothetical protein
MRASFVVAVFAWLIPRVLTAQWSMPVEVTDAAFHYADVSTATSAGSVLLFDTEEYMACTAEDTSGRKRIVVLQTMGEGLTWRDTAFYVVEDSLEVGAPSIARAYNSGGADRLMVVWERAQNGGEIFFDYFDGLSWTGPQGLTSDTIPDSRPFVVPYDDGFGLVWARAGQIMFMQYANDIWNGPVAVTPGDSGNRDPELMLVTYVSAQPLFAAVWEKVKSPDTSSAVLLSTGRLSGWAAGDTVVWDGDNRRPHFFRGLFEGDISLTYDSDRFGRRQILVADGFWLDPNIQWYSRSDSLPYQGTAAAEDASYTNTPIVTGNEGRRLYLFAAGCWRSLDAPDDSIALVQSPEIVTRVSAGTGAINLGPRTTSGLLLNTGYARIWSVWENVTDGRLYGSRIDIAISAIGPNPSLPHSARLGSNYPNPFNPSTTLRYTLDRPSIVSLRIYNVLGQEVKRLVSHVRKPAGEHKVVWDGTNQNGYPMPSGIYLYRLSVDGRWAQTRTMTLVK